MRTITLLCILCIAAATGIAAPTPAQANPEAKTETIKGVIDEQGSDYVISDSESMKPIAVLQSVGFTKTAFARFVGMPVQARGTVVTEKDQKILQIRNIADIKELPPPGQ